MSTDDESLPLTASINDTVTGAWLVATETGSTYRVDLDARTLSRGGSAEPLRHDNEALPLHTVLQCRVGTCADFLIEVIPGSLTLRTTSHVTSIRPDPH